MTSVRSNTVSPVMRNVGTYTSDAEDGMGALQEDSWENPMELTQVSKEIKPYKSSRP